MQSEWKFFTWLLLTRFCKALCQIPFTEYICCIFIFELFFMNLFLLCHSNGHSQFYIQQISQHMVPVCQFNSLYLKRFENSICQQMQINYIHKDALYVIPNSRIDWPFGFVGISFSTLSLIPCTHEVDTQLPNMSFAYWLIIWFMLSIAFGGFCLFPCPHETGHTNAKHDIPHNTNGRMNSFQMLKNRMHSVNPCGFHFRLFHSILLQSPTDEYYQMSGKWSWPSEQWRL